MGVAAEAGDHEGAGEEHEEAVDDGGHGDAGAVEEAEGDAEGERAVLDAGFDREGDALGAGQTEEPSGGEAEGHGEEVERDGGGAGHNELVREVFFAGDGGGDDEGEEDEGENIGRTFESAGQGGAGGAHGHAAHDGKDGDEGELAEGFPKGEAHGTAAGEEPVHRQPDDPRDGENTHHAGDSGEGDGEGGVAPRQVRYDIRGGAAGAGGEDHEADGEFAGQAEGEG